MKPISKALLAINLATLSTSVFACASTTFPGTYRLADRTVTVDEKPRCSRGYTYREWTPHQRPRHGKAALTLFSDIDSSTPSRIQFNRRSGAKYILTAPHSAFAPNSNTDRMDRLRLTIIEPNGTKTSQTLKRIDKD